MELGEFGEFWISTCSTEPCSNDNALAASASLEIRVIAQILALFDEGKPNLYV
jgi:hypothetical protein